VQYRRLLSHENATLLQSAVHRWIVSGGLERHIRKTRRRYEERCHTLGEALAAAKDEGLVDFTMPDGGMAIWVDCRRDSDAIAAAALRAGIFVSPESAYRQDSRPGTCLRLGFSNQTPQELQNGIRRLLPILAREPA
jgi:GntR family transcriptional regulator/MocR family aminotransferase